MLKRSIISIGVLVLFLRGYGCENFVNGSKEEVDTSEVPASEHASEPFAFGDFSWLNGTSRKMTPPAFDSKYFTGDVVFDLNYTHSYNHPIDNTVVGSTALARNNELQLSFMGMLRRGRRCWWDILPGQVV